MAPIALTTSYGSPIGYPVKKSQTAAANQDQGLSLDADGDSTPYSSTSTAVSEQGDHAQGKDLNPKAKDLVEESLPPVKPTATDTDYFTTLLASSQPTPSTKAGATVYASAVEVLEALAVQQSESVWVYDDAVQVGFGARSLAWDEKVFSVQTRQGAGLELAGYKQKKKAGITSVFATTSTLPHLLPSLSSISGGIVIHLATTAPSASLELGDSLFAPGVMKSLASLPDEWEVVFSSGREIVDAAARIYGGESRKVIHVIESTLSGRETTGIQFPSVQTTEAESFTLHNAYATEIYVAPSGHLASSLQSVGLLELKSLSPSPDSLFSALTSSDGARKTISVLGGTKADAEALKAVILGALYSASGSSKAVLPIVKAVLTSSVATAPHSNDAKTISFFTAPLSPLPQLLAHLFLSSPALTTRLAQFGSASARGVKSVLALSPSAAVTQSISVNARSDVVWVSDANVLKTTDVLAGIVEGGILVLELPWTEEEIPVKLSRKELIAIKEKKLRVFLLDLDPASPANPIREQVAFLLLYTGNRKLPGGITKVLDAFYSGNLHRDEIEDAQAALDEVDPTGWELPELEEGKVEKEKSAWEWDALPGDAGVVNLNEEEKPVLSSWDLAARHMLFREAFAVTDAKTVDPEIDGPGIAALRPSTSDETFLVTVSENRRLTPQSYDRNVFHMELDSRGTGLKYEIGEAIGIHGWNDASEVLEFCKWYGLDPDSLVSFPNPLLAGTMETRTAFQLLQQNIDLFGRPGKAFYAGLSKLATSKADAMSLKFISAPEGADLFKRMAEKETVTFADVLYKYRTARPSIEELVGLIPEIKPRHYSIASSQKAVGDKVELLIVTVDWLNSKGESGRVVEASV